MRIIILAGGATHGADPDAQDSFPVLLAEAGGRTLLERIVAACGPLSPTRLIFALRERDVRRYHLDNILEQAAPGAAVVPVRAATAGAACTALLAIHHIGAEEELLLLNGNEEVEADYEDVVRGFRTRDLDGGVIVFPSLHPRYSYVRLDEEGLVTEAAEKNPISRNATAGFYWWRRGAAFVAAAQAAIRKDAHVNGAFYICPTFNELVLGGGRIGVHRIGAERYRPMKSSRQLEHFEAGAVP